MDCSPLVFRGLEIFHPWYPLGSRLFTSGVQGARDYSTLVSGGLKLLIHGFQRARDCRGGS